MKSLICKKSLLYSKHLYIFATYPSHQDLEANSRFTCSDYLTYYHSHLSLAGSYWVITSLGLRTVPFWIPFFRILALYATETGKCNMGLSDFFSYQNDINHLLHDIKSGISGYDWNKQHS